VVMKMTRVSRFLSSVSASSPRRSCHVRFSADLGISSAGEIGEHGHDQPHCRAEVTAKTDESTFNALTARTLGLDALTLLKNRDTRVIFITTTLFNIPLAAFYRSRPRNCANLGLTHTSAWLSLAQTSEIIAMFSLGWLLLNWRLKMDFCLRPRVRRAAVCFVRVQHQNRLLLGIFLHGASFTLVFVIAQIYLEQRIDPAWRARAQALLSLMNGGIGNLIAISARWCSANARCAPAHIGRCSGADWRESCDGSGLFPDGVSRANVTAIRPPERISYARIFSICASSSPVKFKLRVAPRNRPLAHAARAMSALVTALCRNTHASAICASV